MLKLIDADKLKKHYAWWDNEDKKIFDTIVDLQPTVDAVPLEDYKSMEQTVNKLTKAIADAEPVRHGHWEKPQRHGVMTYDEHAYAECSCCHEPQYLARRMNYCPNCGYKIDNPVNFCPSCGFKF